MKTCPDCGSPVEISATKCDFCNYIFDEVEIEKEEKKLEQKKKEAVKRTEPQKEVVYINQAENKETNKEEISVIKAILSAIAGIALIVSFFLPFYDIPVLSWITEVSGLNIVKNFDWISDLDFRIVAFFLGPIVFGAAGITILIVLAQKKVHLPAFAFLYILFVFGYFWYAFEKWNAIFKIADVGFYVGFGAIILATITEQMDN